VVLSARVGDVFSVSRSKVKVFDAEIKAEDKGEYLEFENIGDAEINLFNWKVENKGVGFIFQPNTIILPHSVIKLDKKLLTMKGFDNSQDLVLRNALKKEIFTKTMNDKVSLAELSKRLENIKQELLVIRTKTENMGITSQI